MIFCRARKESVGDVQQVQLGFDQALPSSRMPLKSQTLLDRLKQLSPKKTPFDAFAAAVFGLPLGKSLFTFCYFTAPGPLCPAGQTLAVRCPKTGRRHPGSSSFAAASSSQANAGPGNPIGLGHRRYAAASRDQHRCLRALDGAGQDDVERHSAGRGGGGARPGPRLALAAGVEPEEDGARRVENLHQVLRGYVSRVNTPRDAQGDGGGAEAMEKSCRPMVYATAQRRCPPSPRPP